MPRSSLFCVIESSYSRGNERFHIDVFPSQWGSVASAWWQQPEGMAERVRVAFLITEQPYLLAISQHENIWGRNRAVLQFCFIYFCFTFLHLVSAIGLSLYTVYREYSRQVNTWKLLFCSPKHSWGVKVTPEWMEGPTGTLPKASHCFHRLVFVTSWMLVVMCSPAKEHTCTWPLTWFRKKKWFLRQAHSLPLLSSSCLMLTFVSGHPDRPAVMEPHTTNCVRYGFRHLLIRVSIFFFLKQYSNSSFGSHHSGQPLLPMHINEPLPPTFLYVHYITLQRGSVKNCKFVFYDEIALEFLLKKEFANTSSELVVLTIGVTR